MPLIAAQSQKAPASHKARPAVSPDLAPHLPPIQVGSAAPSADRQRSCPCGGGCPRCQGTPAVPGPGLPLSDDQRAYFEPRLRADLRAVRLHTGPGGAKSASALNAQAYTVGQNIVFGSGQYAPRTPWGQRLLAHELVHTLQQSPSRHDAPSRIPGGQAEQATDLAAQAVLSSRPLPGLTQTGVGVARQATTNDPAKLSDEALVNETVYLVNDIKAGRLKPGTEPAYLKYLQLLVNQFITRGISNPSLLSKNQYLLEAAFSSLGELAQVKPKPQANITPPATAHEPNADDQFDLLTAISEEFGRSFAGKEADTRVTRLAALFGALEADYARKVDEVITKGKLRQQFEKIPSRARRQLTEILTQREGKAINLRPGVLGKGSKKNQEWDYYIVREGVSIDDIARYLSTDADLPTLLENYNHIPHNKSLSAGTQVYVDLSRTNRPEARNHIREDFYHGKFIPSSWGATKISHSGERKLRRDDVPLTRSEYDQLEENERSQAIALKTLKKMDEDSQKHLKEDLKRAQQVPSPLLTFFFPTSALYVKDQSSLISNPLLRFQYQTAQRGFYAGTNLGRVSGAVAVAANMTPLLVLDAAALPELASVLGATETGTAIVQGARGLYLWAGANPYTAQALTLFGANQVYGIAQAGGVRNYLKQITSDPAAFAGFLYDALNVYQGRITDRSFSNSGSSGSTLSVDEPTTTAPAPTKPPKPISGGTVGPVDEPPAISTPPVTQTKAGGGGLPPTVDEPPVISPAPPARPATGTFGIFSRWKALQLSGAILKGAGDLNPPDPGVARGAPRPAIIQPANPPSLPSASRPTPPAQPAATAPVAVEVDVPPAAPVQAIAPGAPVQPAPTPVQTTQPAAAQPAPPPAQVQPTPTPVQTTEPAPVQPTPPPVQVQPAPVPVQATQPAAAQPTPSPAVQVQPAPPPAPVKPGGGRRIIVTPSMVKPKPPPAQTTTPAVTVTPAEVKPTEAQIDAKQEQEAGQAPLPSQVSSVIAVGEVLSVPYGGSFVRAKVVEVKDGQVTFRYETKHRISGVERPGSITEQLPQAYLEGKIKTGQVIRWIAERQRLMDNRPDYDEGLVDTVWEKARQPDGKVYDPHSKQELAWDRSKNRFDQWHMGHRPGHEYAKLVDRYIQGEITLDEFMKEYNHPDNYWPEDPKGNLSHKNEAPRRKQGQ